MLQRIDVLCTVAAHRSPPRPRPKQRGKWQVTNATRLHVQFAGRPGLANHDPPIRGCCLFNTTGKTLRLLINNARRPAPRAKIFIFPDYRIYDLTKSSRPHEGRFAIVTIRGAGCDGRGCVARRAAQSRTVKPCGPVPSMLGSSCAKRFCAATVTKTPDTPGRAWSKP